jgi:hypothetical protein
MLVQEMGRGEGVSLIVILKDMDFCISLISFQGN